MFKKKKKEQTEGDEFEAECIDNLLMNFVLKGIWEMEQQLEENVGSGEFLFYGRHYRKDVC